MRPGDKQKGLDQLTLASQQSLFSRVEATLYLTHILTDYENRASEALPYLAQLARQYPNNPFFFARYAEVLLNARRLAPASALIDSLLVNTQPIYKQIGLGPASTGSVSHCRSRCACPAAPAKPV